MRELLERHNPVLVIFPQDPSRARPGAFRPRDGWGDYHPCSADFFLDRAVRRDCPERYDFVSAALSRFSRDSWAPLEPDRFESIAGFLKAARPEQSARWELDICEIPSQDPVAAWSAYARFLNDTRADARLHRSVTYARAIDVPGGRVLQYWYLYTYNDFVNQHEGDWEMVTVRLGAQDEPAEVAYSNHHGGVRRAWQDAPREGTQPLVYVARGSHAGYFRYASHGHPLVGELGTGRVPRALAFLVPLRQALNFAIRMVQRVPGIRLYRDNPPADPVLDADAPADRRGMRLTPPVVVMPDEEEVGADAELWWMRFRGHWGSTRPRIIGSVGVIGPWASTSALDRRWRDPVAWMQHCKLETGEQGAIAATAERVVELAKVAARKAGVAGPK